MDELICPPNFSRKAIPLGGLMESAMGKHFWEPGVLGDLDPKAFFVHCELCQEN